MAADEISGRGRMGTRSKPGDLLAPHERFDWPAPTPDDGASICSSRVRIRLDRRDVDGAVVRLQRRVEAVREGWLGAP